MTQEPNSIRMDINMPSLRASGAQRLVAEIKKKTLRDRLLSALFGPQHEILIIMPSRDVRNVVFTRQRDEKEEGAPE